MAGSVGTCLRKGEASRPPARFNRPGQDALYLSPDPASARVAIGGTVRADDPPRVLLRFEVSACQLVDLRLPSASALYESASQPWRDPLAAGLKPRTWDASDELRSQGHTGLIDPSRRVPGLWHVTLFRWNEPGAPTVRPIGTPEPIEIEPDIS